MITGLLLLASVLAGQAAPPADEAARLEVRRLVRQLDAAELDQRNAAETELLRRGPAVLDLLPAVTARTPAETAQRLGRIRQQLQEAVATAAADASTVTLNADAMPLLEVLAAFQRQTHNTIVDYRAKFGQPQTNPPVRVHFDKTPFWPALDAVLDQAGMSAYLFSGQPAIGVVNAASPAAKRPLRVGRACCCGPFRVEPVRLTANRELRETRGGSLRVTLEVAWEPRLRMICLWQRMADVAAADQHGNSLLRAGDAAQFEAPISGRAPVVEFTLPFPLPAREVQTIAQLNGKFTAIIPGRIETFRFGQLGQAKNVSQRIAEAVVTLEDVRKNAAGWEVRMRVRFDDAGDALASHRTWIFNNAALLEDAAGKTLHYASFETTLQKKNEVGVAFQFDDPRPLDGMTFIYKTPGAIVTKEFAYELRDIRLP